MQPTLHGVNTYDDSRKDPVLGNLTEAEYLREQHKRNVSVHNYKSNKLRAFLDSLYYGQQYDEIITSEGGTLRMNASGGVWAQAVSMRDMAVKTIGFPLLESYSRININDEEIIVPIPWHKLERDQNSEVFAGRVFKPGQTIFKGVSEDGDHLFVNRVVYNFRNPKRGDISVFMTDQIKDKDQKLRGQFYIKRLVGMPNETIRIKGGRVYKVIDGKEIPLNETDHECFKKIYSHEDGYHGHQRAYEGGFLSTSWPKLYLDGEDVVVYNTIFVKTSKGYEPRTRSISTDEEPVWKDHTPRIEKGQVILYSDNEEIYFKDLGNGLFYLSDVVRKDGYEAHYGLEYDEYKLGNNQYFMLGDNTGSSLDSRYLGPVPRKSLIGTAFSVFWPFSHRWGFAARIASILNLCLPCRIMVVLPSGKTMTLSTLARVPMRKMSLAFGSSIWGFFWAIIPSRASASCTFLTS